MGSCLLLATTARPENLSIFDPASPSAASIRDLFLLLLFITGGILLVFESVLVYSIIRFRRKPDTSTAEPPQVYGSKPIEVAWTVAPALIAFVIALLLIRTVFEVRVDPDQPPPGSKPLYVTVVGHQWWWEYVYEKYDGKELKFTTANELRVPASADGVARPVYLTLKSADVCHSYWVPRLAGKTDLIPGRTNHLWFQPRAQGVFHGQCAEYCGTQHAKMLLRVEVDSPDDFQRWLDNERKPAVEEPKGKAGKEAFLKVACVNCHAVRGTSARGTFGPDLTHLMSRKTLATGLVPNTRAELRRWVVDPQVVKPGCLMPAMKLPENQVDLVVDYLQSLR